MSFRRLAWTLMEVKMLINSFDSPIQVLVDLFPRHTQASIERKIARLRKEGKIGMKSAETKQLAYDMRHRKDGA